MKNKISCALAATLAVSPIQGFANEVVINDNIQQPPVEDSVNTVTGKLEVDINFAIPIVNSSSNDMKIKVRKQNGDFKTDIAEVLLKENSGDKGSIKYYIRKLDGTGKEVQDKEKVSFIRIAFENLPLGSYEFELSGNGYKTTKVDNIDITSFSKRVKIGTKENKVVTEYKESVKKENSEDIDNNKYEIYPALFLAGDTKEDSIINMDDYNIILENVNKDSELKYDINKDGKTDISDLYYVKSSIGNKLDSSNNRSYIVDTDKIINPENVSMAVAPDLKVEGDLKDLLKSNDSTVKIESKQAPTSENPLSIEMDLTGEEIQNPTPPSQDNEGSGETQNPDENKPSEDKNLLDTEDESQNNPESGNDNSKILDTSSQENSESKEENIAEFKNVVKAQEKQEAVTMEQVVIKAPNVDGAPETGKLVYYVEGKDTPFEVPFTKENKITRNGQSDIVINLGSQVAVKKISIDVTGNRGNKNISEIAKIEFLNNVYKEIPKPIISIPVIKTLETSTDLHDERITISWDAQPNVTGYEIKYSKINDKGEKVGPEKKLQTNKTNFNILDKAIKPYDKFRVSIQSLNGEWSSGYAEDLAKLDKDKGGLSDEDKLKLIPYTLDGTADNVDANFNMKESYYGKPDGSVLPNMGSVSDIQVIPLNSPEPPRNLKTKEGYRSFTVSWENHIQARDFDIYFRKLGEEKWKKANDSNKEVNENDEAMTNPDKSKLSRSHSYTINNLEDEATYEVRVTATNHLGTSKMSESYLGKTISINPPKMPDYKLINKPKHISNNAEDNTTTDSTVTNIPTEHIVDVVNHKDAVVDSKYAVVDNDYSTTYVINDWDAGGSYNNFRGPMVEFDKEYTIDRISLAISQQQGNFGNPSKVRVRGFDELGNEKMYIPRTITTKSSNGKEYTTLKFDEAITVKKIQVNPHVYSTQRVSISELKFHESDGVESDLRNLYEDPDFRVELKKDVIQADLDALKARANTMDPISKEYNPDRSNILKEIDIAHELLIGADLSNKITTLDTKIRTNTGGPGLGMGNDWQSLGSVARPGKDEDNNGKKIVVYVASNDNNAKVQIGFLQNYGQPGEYIKTDNKSPYVLGTGRHEISIPQISTAMAESGGQVMARVHSVAGDKGIKIRLASVDEIPSLNVNNLINDNTKEAEVKEKIKLYIKELKKYVSNLPRMYPSKVTPDDIANNIYTYEETTSPLNSTDIEGDRFTLTVPASQILKGIESGLGSNEEAQVNRVYDALLAWEQQIKVTYSKKGVYEEAQDFNGNGTIDNDNKNTNDLIDGLTEQQYFEKHKAPQTRMNIKYQRMMMGAAAYASGHHVGIGYGMVPSYMQGVPFKFDENQNVINGDKAHLYGDIIAHEIGHVTDIGQRIYDETSNNITALITSGMLNQNTSMLSNDTYKKMYEKATSNTLGLSTDRSVVLGMLWQPFLAYENNDTYKMLFNDNDNNKNNDSHYAKLNRAYRTMTDEEKVDSVNSDGTKVYGDRDQLLIRMTSKVTGKNLIPFYESYGMVANKKTEEYIKDLIKSGKITEETRPIQYINDEARRQRLANNAEMASDTKIVASFGKDNKGNQIKDKSYVNQTSVPFNLSVNKDNDKILGYEILRDGQPAGFVEKSKNSNITTYNDVVDNMNNRVFTYEAVAYDYNLNATEKISLGTVKVRHDGSVNKNSLNITTNTIEKDESNYDEHSFNPNPSLKNVLDNDDTTIYQGTKKNKEEDPYIILDAKEVRPLAGIKYTAPTSATKFLKRSKTSKSAITNYEIQISKFGNDWTTVKSGTFKLNPNNPTETIYFDKQETTGKNQLNVYNTRFVKLVAKGASEISVAELDLIAPPGDNIEIGVADDNINYKNGIGLLKEEFVYEGYNENTKQNEKKSIPKGSVIITGEYRGNPAFNVPLVLNEKGEHIAEQYNGILMADVPDKGNLEEISEGNWVYWVEPQYVNQFMKNKQIFAELYRTDTADATTDGQRLVSDTFKIDVPDELLEISLSGGQGRNYSKNMKYIEIDSKTIKKVATNR